MNGDQFRSCIPSRLLMASESTCSAAEERLSGCFWRHRICRYKWI